MGKVGMGVSGREQTLLSIYGHVPSAKKRKRQKPTAQALAVRRPPPTSVALETSLEEAEVRNAGAQRRTTRPTPHLRFPSEKPNANGDGEDREEDVRPAVPALLALPPGEPNKRGGSKLPSPRRVRGADKAQSGAVSTAGKSWPSLAEGNAVISLYGDGFLEVPVSLGQSDGEQEPGNLLADDGNFTIRMLLFKAADIEMHRTKVDSKGARHKSPEIDDSGEFVRWTCCGSTNRSVFGCSLGTKGVHAAVAHQTLPRRHSQALDESPPKLLVSRLFGDNATEGETSFAMYDRGPLLGYNGGAEDGGCRVQWRGLECWANNYQVPSNRWVKLTVVFDCRFLQVFFDDELADCARISPITHRSDKESGSQRGRQLRLGSTWVAGSSNSTSVYIGGHPSHARSVRDWRSKIGFVGLISSFQLWSKCGHLRPPMGNNANPSHDAVFMAELSHSKKILPSARFVPVIGLTIPEVGCVRDGSGSERAVNMHRNVFWRKVSPPSWEPLPQWSPSLGSEPVVSKGSIVLLSNFFHGAHNDVNTVHSKRFENLLLSALQTGNICVMIDYALEFDLQRGHDHVCRTQAEYEAKSLAVVRAVECMSPLLAVAVNESNGGAPAPMGSFEITMELTRAAGRSPVSIVLHSMAASGFFPNHVDIKKKVESIVLFEAKRSPGEDIITQAFRHLLALASQTRHNRERSFMESVINRKLVLTEKKAAAVFAKIGFFFAASELPGVVAYFKRIQENYSRVQSHRMDDLPSMSMLTPSSTGLYTLPFMSNLSVSSTLECDSSDARPPWRFVCVLVDYDFQLVDFVHGDCPVSKRRGVSFRQGQHTHEGFADRVNLRFPALSHRVFCVLLSLQKIMEEENGHGTDLGASEAEYREMPNVHIQIENVEERHVLGMFDAKPTAGCRWFTLAAVYRSRKNNLWRLQALGGCGAATSIYASLDEVNILLAEHHIIQTYEVRVAYVVIDGDEVSPEQQECEEFARRFAKNIRFGRNGRIVMLPIAGGDDGASRNSHASLRIALKLQELETEVDVYTRDNTANQPLPTIQSVCRTLLRILAQHGIKESLQQNPFASQNKKAKRHVEIRVVSAQTNEPVEKAHLFIEKNLEFGTLSSNLAKTVLPTLTMGSRLMSIRRRLQKKRALEITREVTVVFVAECVAKGTKRAIVASNTNVKIWSLIRARGLLRTVIRRRYEKIKADIFERVRKSEHAREYSKMGPLRLQRLLTTSLVLSESEHDLLQRLSGEELALLENMLLKVSEPETARHNLEADHLRDEWRLQFELHKNQGTNLSNPDDVPSMGEGDNSGVQLGVSPKEDACQNESKGGKNTPGAQQTLVKERRQLLVADSNGQASCRLVPGSYSLYVFHLDYFEWTSLVAVYPTVAAAGPYGGPTTSCAAMQEIVIPLDVFRWTYSLQLADFYQPHIPIKIAGVPLQITETCSSQRQVVTTDANGCATWEVRKGLYAVDILKECNCVLYSTTKNVIVDGGRYRSSRTICIPVLFGSVRVEVLVASAVPTANPAAHPGVASVRFHAVGVEGEHPLGIRTVEEESVNGECVKDDRSEAQMTIGSSRPFQLRLGTYRLEVSAPLFLCTVLPVAVTWDSSKIQAQDRNRYLAVLSPMIQSQQTFRVVLAYMDGVQSMDMILEIWKDGALVGHVWRQSTTSCHEHVRLEGIQCIEGCEYQSLLLQCQEGYTYKCVVGSSLHSHSMARSLRPQVQVYSSAGLVYQNSQTSKFALRKEFYWEVCSWNSRGELVAPE